MSPDLPSKTTTPRANPHPTHWQRFRLPNPKMTKPKKKKCTQICTHHESFKFIIWRSSSPESREKNMKQEEKELPVYATFLFYLVIPRYAVIMHLHPLSTVSDQHWELHQRRQGVGDEAAGAMGAGVLPRGLEADGEEAEPQRLLHVRGHHRAAA